MANNFAFTISAVDKASAKLEAVNKKINALKPRADVIDATAKLAAMQKKIADTSGITRLNKAFAGLARTTVGVFQNVARIVTPLSAIAGAASVAGMFRLAEAWANFGSQLGFASQRIGISGDQLQSLQGAARLAGSSSEALTGGLQNLGQTMFDAIGGRAPEAVIMFNKLGVSFRDATGHARQVRDVLPELANKIAGIKDPYAQALVAQTMFGGSAEAMLPFLRRGAAGIADLTETARRYGVINQRGIDAANQLREAQTRLGLAVEGLGNSIAEQLAPALTPLLTQFADWIAKNREWISTGIGDAVKDFAEYIKSVDWKAVGQGVKEFGGEVQRVVDMFGGWKNVAEDLMIFMGVKWVAGMMAPILQVGAALTSLAARTAAMGLGIGPAAVGAVAVAGAYGLYNMVKDPSLAVTYGGNGADGLTPSDEASKGAAGGGFGRLGEWLGLGVPRGIRNNNPLNLSYVPGQQGAVGSDGRFGVYGSMQDGIAAAERQLVRYQARGLTSLAQIVGAWAPAAENDTKSYIADLAKRTGFDPNKPLDVHNPAVASAIIAAMGHHETGRDIDPGIIAQGVSRALGAPVAVPSMQMASAPMGQATITVRHVNAPPGSTVTAATSGNIFSGAPKVAQSLPAWATP